MLINNFLPFTDIVTPRLLLRRITTDDAMAIKALRSNPHVMKFIPRPLVKSIAEALTYIEMLDSNLQRNEAINWGICLKDTEQLIGTIGLYRFQFQNCRAELGYMLLPEFHRKGLITEAIQNVLTYSFSSLNLHSLEAIISPDNLASERTLQKCGFVKEAHFKEAEFYNGKFNDCVVYSLLAPSK